MNQKEYQEPVMELLILEDGYGVLTQLSVESEGDNSTEITPWGKLN